MAGVAGEPRPLVEWGAAAVPLEGQTDSGDRCVIRAFRGGVLVAALDGLGHGEEAAVAANTAVEVLERHAGEALVELVRRCHQELRGTRGVVMSLALFHAAERRMSWVGVGNVAGVVLRASGADGQRRTTLLAPGGVVGYQLPVLRPEVVELAAGDTAIFATDGVEWHFAPGPTPLGPPERIAERILTRYAKGNDDALVLVVRYLGEER